MNPYFLTNPENDALEKLEVEIRFSAEMDEFWSFVQNKGNQRWTWYAIERNSGIILAWHNGKRRDDDFGQCCKNFLFNCIILTIGVLIQNIFLNTCIE